MEIKTKIKDFIIEKTSLSQDDVNVFLDFVADYVYSSAYAYDKYARQKGLHIGKFCEFASLLELRKIKNKIKGLDSL